MSTFKHNEVQTYLTKRNMHGTKLSPPSFYDEAKRGPLHMFVYYCLYIIDF